MSEIHGYSNLFSLKGKTAVVTGGSRGLGLHAATGLLLAGCTTVIITSRKVDACDQAVQSLKALHPKANIFAIPADLSKPSEVERLAKEVSAATDGKIDILIANAGATWGAPFDSHPDSAFAKVMDLNVRSVFNLIRLTTPMLEKAAKERGGEEMSRVITVGSVAGIVIGTTGELGTYGYAASKAAVLVCAPLCYPLKKMTTNSHEWIQHMTKHLAVELGPRRILVNAIAPGFFPTKMADGIIKLGGGEEKLGRENPTGRLGKAEDIVGVVVWLCSNGSSHINGVVIPIDGGKHLGGGKL